MIIISLLGTGFGCSTSNVRLKDTLLPKKVYSNILPISLNSHENVSRLSSYRKNSCLQLTPSGEQDVCKELITGLRLKLSNLDFLETAWNMLISSAAVHDEPEELTSSYYDTFFAASYHEEEVIGFPTLAIKEPELFEEPSLIEDQCGDSAFSWCDPLYEDVYPAYREQQKIENLQRFIFPNFVSPVDEGLLLRGIRKPGSKRRRGHYGLDIIPRGRKRGGTPIKSVEDGVVIRASKARGYGYYIIVYHQNGFFSLYSHTLKKGRAQIGEEVNRGQQIAFMGKSGNARGYHLHFELIDLQEIWDLEESIDEIVGKVLYEDPISKQQFRQFNKLLFSKQAKRDPLPYIPGLAYAKRKNGKLIPVAIKKK